MITMVSFAIEVALLVLTPVYRTYKEMHRVEELNNSDNGEGIGGGGDDDNKAKDNALNKNDREDSVAVEGSAGITVEGASGVSVKGSADVSVEGAAEVPVEEAAAGVAVEGSDISPEVAAVAAEAPAISPEVAVEEAGIAVEEADVPAEKIDGVDEVKRDSEQIVEPLSTGHVDEDENKGNDGEKNVEPNVKDEEVEKTAQVPVVKLPHNERRWVFVHWIVYGTFRALDLVARPWVPSFDVIKIIMIVWLCLEGTEDVYQNYLMPVLNEYAPIVDYWLGRYEDTVDQVVATSEAMRLAAAEVTNAMTEVATEDPENSL